MARLLFALLAVLLATVPDAESGAASPSRPCGDALDYQVRLDRIGFSPGEIDGTFGRNTRLAIGAFQEASGLQPSGAPDCDTWRALSAKGDVRLLVDYAITADDAAGPFVRRIPADLAKQAHLFSLGYTSVLEALGEKFHVKPSLLRRLNRRTPLRAGEKILVPNVTLDLNAGALATPASSQDYVIEVTRDRSALTLRDADGKVVLFAPATVGSRHDPLPLGDWHVTDIAWSPVFHYNPELFWDADPHHATATIASGPNNPVGVVWIGLDIPHYGIHGTPDPGLVGHAYSHGCVRLANWDAARVARLVRRGTRVQFR